MTVTQHTRMTTTMLRTTIKRVIVQDIGANNFNCTGEGGESDIKYHLHVQFRLLFYFALWSYFTLQTSITKLHKNEALASNLLTYCSRECES